MSMMRFMFIIISAALGQLSSVTSLPDALFNVNSGMRDVVEGTVIQLYCVADSTAATFSWTKDGSSVVINVPHLRERTWIEGDTAASMLTIDGFYSTDNGAYECTAMDGASTVSGDTTVLTGMVYFILTCVCIQFTIIIVHHFSQCV